MSMFLFFIAFLGLCFGAPGTFVAVVAAIGLGVLFLELFA